MSAESARANIQKAVLMLLAAALLAGAVSEFYNVAFGTGLWLGGFSLKWGAAFLAFTSLCLVSWLVAAQVLWQPARFETVSAILVRWRTRLGIFRWLALAFVLAAPIWFLQYSPWGVVFSRDSTRLLIWLLAVLLAAFLLERGVTRVWTWGAFLAALLLTGAGFVLIVPFGQVTSYPFALGWSEGNRLWDYSLLFGSHLYKYPPADPPAAYLEPGRQLVGAIPYLVPGLSIAAERAWVAMLDVVPYLALGFLTFRPSDGQRDARWVLLGIWGFIFLSQGPIHPPLLVCAMLVALAWGESLWVAVPLLVVSGYFAEISRFTWIFAPAIWAVMLEFGSAIAHDNRIPAKAWMRAIVMGLAGLLGSLVVPRLLSMLHLDLGIRSSASGAAAGGVTVTTVTSAASSQSLLWYRLFPNATYGAGTLLGLLIAVGPIAGILLYLSFHGWKLSRLQKLALVLPSLAFLAAGLVISTKIGGGGDLHNMDMLFIGILFAGALAWRSLGVNWIGSLPGAETWIKGLLALAIALPASQPLMALRPLSFASDENWLVVLTDVARPKDLGSLPTNAAMTSDLNKLRAAVRDAQATGDVLFMDQRQLLTFGYISGVALVPEYEKKEIMDKALSGDQGYFQPFYRDLAAHRFSLIISDPLRTPVKGSDYGFGEENNAWVKWVTKPVLCYYEEKDTLTNVNVQLLIPRPGPNDCTAVLP